MNKLAQFFYNEPKRRAVHKWEHYLDIYDKHFKKFQGKNPKILEIGVYKGGSIDMWKWYFGECTIYAIDIDPACKALEIKGLLNFGTRFQSPILKSSSMTVATLCTNKFIHLKGCMTELLMEEFIYVKTPTPVISNQCLTVVLKNPGHL